MKNNIARTLLLLSIAGLFIFAGVLYARRERWPDVVIKPEYAEIVDASVANYKKNNYDYRKGLHTPYESTGRYADKIDMSEFEDQPRISFDEEGIPVVSYEMGDFYNPVTISQYSFARYAQYLDGDESARGKFLDSVDCLVRRQKEDGSFRYEFPWKIFHAEEPFPAGWVSGMAQGQTLSAFSRAYHMTKDKRYLEAGDASLKFLLTDKKDGGTTTNLSDLDPSLDNYVFYEEYVSTPDNYTLNGYMFTLLGLYDWACLSEQYDEVPKNDAKRAFDDGIRTLEKILPYYDIGGYTTYDLGHITFDDVPHVVPKYHMYHILLADNLYTVTGSSVLKKYIDLWKSYIE